MIVIDVGCARYGGKYDSIERLMEMFAPMRLYGFDASMEGARDAAFWLPPAGPNDALALEYSHLVLRDPQDTLVTISATAAWTYDGQIGFFPDGLAGWTGDGDSLRKVPCFDLAAFIDNLPPGPIILKLDCEGAEYALLRHLIATNVDARLQCVLVEWHSPDEDHGAIIAELACPYEEWLW